MAFGGRLVRVPLAESEPEENLGAPPAGGTSRLWRAKPLQLAFATAAVAGCGTFAVLSLSQQNKAKSDVVIPKVQSKYSVSKQWQIYDENCITAPDRCPYGTKCMLKDDSWAACLYPGQCEPGKFVKIECEGPENQRVFGGETTYCKKWECCTLTKPRHSVFEEDVYSDKLPPDYKPYLAVGPVAPPDRLSPHPWQPACEKNGCPPTTTGCLTSTTPGCPPVETTADATSTAESAVWTTIQDSTAVTEIATTTKETVTTESSTTTEEASSATTSEGAATTTEATTTEAAATTTEAAATTSETAATTTEATTTEATTTEATTTEATTTEAATTEAATTEAATTTNEASTVTTATTASTLILGTPL